MTNRVEIGKLSNYTAGVEMLQFDIPQASSSSGINNNNTGTAEFEVTTAGNLFVYCDISFFFQTNGNSGSTRTIAYNAAKASVPDQVTLTFQKSTNGTSWTTFSTQTRYAAFQPNAYSANLTTTANQWGYRIFSTDPTSPYIHTIQTAKHNQVTSGVTWGNGTIESDLLNTGLGNGYIGTLYASGSFSAGTNYVRVQMTSSDSGYNTAFDSQMQRRTRTIRVSPTFTMGSGVLQTDVAGSHQTGTSYGLKISKANVNVQSCRPDQVLFDSRFNRTGVIYGGGFQSAISSTSSTGVNFQGSKTALTYTPLVWATEDAVDQIDTNEEAGVYPNSDNNNSDYQEYAQMYITTKTNLIPAQMYHDQSNYDQSSDQAVRTGRNLVTGSGTANDKTCKNLNFRVLKIPLGYGYMTDTYYGDGTSTNTNRVVIGKYTNSNAGYSSAARGIFVSRAGTNVLTCSDDELIFNTDQGGATSLTRGQYQTMTVNLSDVVNNAAEPTSVAVVTGITSTNSPQISYSIPYTFTAPTGYQSVAPQIATTTTSVSGGGTNTSFDLSFSESFNTSTNISTITLSTSTTGASLTASLAPVKFDSTFALF